MEKKRKKVEVLVPGKQITIAQIIANPNPDVYLKLGVSQTTGSIGILTLTPKETAVIAGDLAMKHGNVSICVLDRFKGTVVITGRLATVDFALQRIVEIFHTALGFDVPQITRT